MSYRQPIALGLAGLLLLACDSADRAEEAPAASASEAKASEAKADSAPRAEAPPPSFPSGAEDKSIAAPAAPPSPGYVGDGGGRGGEGEAAAAPSFAAKGAADERAERWDAPRPQPAFNPGQLTAGRWSDRDDWARWQGLLAYGSQYRGVLDAWSLTAHERVAVTVDGPTGKVADARVVLEDAYGRAQWEGRTDNQGRVELMIPPGQAGKIVVRSADGRVLASRNAKAGEQHELRVTETPAVGSALDLMFVVDTTGSMGDELSYLQNELTDIVARVQRGSGQDLQVRTSVGFYKDHGDDYVVRSFPFTTDLGQTLGHLRAEYASGGGDYPEALDAALTDAVRGHQWSDSAVARVMFVITDAPAHDGAQVGHELQSTIALAASKGIRIVPVASSGVDKPTEFLLRDLAVSTGGTYVFLTDHSGIGNSHIEPTVGPYTVQPLNDLIVDVIGEYTKTEGVTLVDPALAMAHAPVHHDDQPCGYAMGRTSSPSNGWGYLGFGLLIPGLIGGLWWHRSRSNPAPVLDPRVTRARRMADELHQRAKVSRSTDAKSWATQMREVVQGMEQLARQRQAIDASLRVAGMQPEEGDPSGMRASLRAEVARRREVIDAEIDAGLLSVETAYLHVIGGVGERALTQASLDSAREALQTRIEIERELHAGH